MKDRVPAPPPHYVQQPVPAIPSFVDRRTAVRKACSFDVQINTKTGPLKGIGLEIASSGLVFIMPRAPGVEALDIVALIRSHKLPLRVMIVRSDPMSYQFETWFKLMCAIVAPPAEWNTIIDEVLQGPRQRSAPVASATREISFGTLSGSAQQSIIARLINLKRLAPSRPGHAPLVRVTLDLEYRDVNGQMVYRYRVHSRIVQHHHTKSFESIFLVSERDAVTFER